MTDEQKNEIIALAVEYMKAHKDRDRNKETISRQRVLLFIALEKAEDTSEHRRNPEEGARAGSGGHGAESRANLG